MKDSAPASTPYSRGKRYLIALFSLCGIFLFASAQSAVTIDQKPLTVQASLAPNIVLMLDDSGSMAWNFMPDICYLAVPSGSTNSSWCVGTSLESKPNNAALINPSVNGVYYNPSVTYTPPVKANGTSYDASPGLTSAWLDGFAKTAGTLTTAVDLTGYALESTYRTSDMTYSGGGYETGSTGTGTISNRSNIAFSTTKSLTVVTTDTQTPTCDSGYTLSPNGSATVCVGNTAATTPKCSNGGTFDATTGNCVVSTPSPTCPGSLTVKQRGSNYTCSGPGSCTAGTFTASTGVCTVAPTPTISCPSSVGGSPSKFNSANIFTCNSTPTCTSGTYRPASNTCSSGGSVKPCPTGFSISQPSGQSNFTCTAAPTCSGSVAYNNSNNTCTIPTPTCPSGTLTRITSGSNQGYACDVAATCSPGTFQAASGTCTVSSTASCAGGDVALHGTTYQCVDTTPNCSGLYPYASSTGLCTKTTSTTGNYNFFQYSTGSTNTVTYIASTAQGCATQTNCYLETDITGAAAPLGVPAGQNIANWFSYYHTRMLMVKSGLMVSFADIDPTIRVGFGSINGNNESDLPSSTGGTYPVAAVKPFDSGAPTVIGGASTQRAKFWNWVVSANPNSATPLRGALDAVGQYYMTAAPWQSANPVTGATEELACRQSYTILTTDGFWNDSYSGAGDVDGTAGTTITGPNSATPYTYTPAAPYADTSTAKTVITHPTYAACSQYGTGYSRSGTTNCKKGSTTRSPQCTSGDTQSSDGSTCTKTVYTASGNTVSNTLADVALKYWSTDLRTNTANEVPQSTEDKAFWQHMTTFTLGLGFTPIGITPAGTTIDQIFTWANGGAAVNGTFSWPQPTSNSINNIADLAHAAVNGHGGFYSATSPDSFSNGIKDAIARVSTRKGSGSSLASNSTKLDTSTFTYQALYHTGTWTGDLQAFSLDAATGAVATNADGSAHATWSAATALPAAASRNIKTYNPSTGALVAFTTANLTSLPSSMQTALGSTNAIQQKIVNYLRGDATYEQKNAGGTYRSRDTALGDIINSQPIYVGAPNPNLTYGKSFSGTSTYAAYAQSKSTRTPTIWVAANDGMLHSFNASTGAEVFAYLPSTVITNGIANLADPDYGSNSVPHQLFNDGEATVADVFTTLPSGTTAAWRTVLVGTTGRGAAKTIYALDITDPAAPIFLWEKSSADSNAIGQITGQPVIAQIADGSWAVLMGNGYNSSSNTAALLQFDLMAGTLSVHASDSTTNNGLAAPIAWIGSPSNSVSTIAYAADLKGRVWSFVLNTGSAVITSTPTSTGINIFTTSDGTKAQPITAGLLAGKDPKTGNVWLFFGTGQYLNQSDLNNKDVQSWYGIIVQSPTAGIVSNLASWTGSRTASATNALVPRIIFGEVAPTSTTLGGRVVTIPTANDMYGKSGWFIDLKSPNFASPQGERMVTPNQFQGNLLIGTTRIPVVTDPCSPSGSAWIMALDPFTGGNPSSLFFDLNNDNSFNDSDKVVVNGVAYVSAGVGLTSVANNSIFVGNTMLTSLDDGNISKINTAGTVGATSRLSWRELVTH